MIINIKEAEDFRIRGDENNYILQKRTKKGWKTLGYYKTLGPIINKIVYLKILSNNTVIELRDYIQQHKSMVLAIKEELNF